MVARSADSCRSCSSMGLRQHIDRDRSFLWREGAIISNLMDTARLKCHNAAIDVQLNYLVVTMLLLSI